MSERARQHPRYALEATVSLRPPGGETATGRTHNVSRGGLCAVVDRGLRAGTHVEAAIALVFDEDSFSEPLVLPARIVWSTPMGDEHQTGCAFLPLGPEMSTYLEMFLRYLSDAGPDADDADDEDDDEPEDPFAS